MSKALYRKYRPKTLDAVIGEPQVTETLKKALSAHKIAHAYLFIGPRGTGKTSVARILAHAINNFDYELEDDYIDIIEIDAASNTGVENIRELREKAIVAPTKGKYKVYIIDEVHMLSKSAFNALLKTLEEPPAHVIFIMATTDAHKVPITITSRAQTYTFKLADPKIMLPHLKDICQKEHINIEDSALEIIIKRGRGSFRDTLSLLDQISTLSDQLITKSLVLDAIGLPADEELHRLLKTYLSGDLTSLTAVIKDLLSSGLKPETIAEEVIEHIIADPQPTLLPLLDQLPNVRAPFPEAKLLSALLAPFSASPRPASPSPQNRLQSSTTPPSKALPKNPSTPLPARAPKTPSPLTPVDFSWDSFLSAIKAKNDLVAQQLQKTTHQLSNDTLNIYPLKKVTKTILTRNKLILSSVVTNLKIVIQDPQNQPQDSDPLISQISAIMGTVEEVKTNGTASPFQ